MYDNLRPSYEEIHNACMDMALQIYSTHLNIKQIIGIARGGLLPAVVLSHQLSLPLLLVEYSSKHGQGDDKNHKNILPQIDPQDGAILLVDDISDSGKTLNELGAHFTKHGVTCYTAVLYYKIPTTPQTVPDFVWRTIPHDADWIIFPYERNEYLTPDINSPTRHLQSMVRK